MFKHLAHRVGREVGIQRHRHMPGHPDGQVGNNPVRAILGNDRNAAALGQLQAAQPVGRTTGLVTNFGPVQLFYLAAGNGLRQVGFIRVTGFTGVERIQR